MQKKYSKKITDILNKGQECQKKITIIGPTGPAGISEKIFIRSTITKKPGTEAEVIDTKENNTHILDFKIPAGSTPIATFAYKFNDEGDNINLEPNTLAQISLNRTGDFSNMIVDNENKVIIKETGIYKIQYFFSASLSKETALFTQVLKNNETIDGSEISKDVNAQEDTDFYGLTVIRLNPNDVITLAVKARKTAILTPAPDTNAYLYITKLI